MPGSGALRIHYVSELQAVSYSEGLTSATSLVNQLKKVEAPKELEKFAISAEDFEKSQVYGAAKMHFGIIQETIETLIWTAVISFNLWPVFWGWSKSIVSSIGLDATNEVNKREYGLLVNGSLVLSCSELHTDRDLQRENYRDPVQLVLFLRAGGEFRIQQEDNQVSKIHLNSGL